MIRDPQNVSPVDPRYSDPKNGSSPVNRASPRGYESRDMPTGNAIAYIFGAILLLAGAMWAFAPRHSVTATTPPITTTGQGSSQTRPLPSVQAPSIEPIEPREKSGGDNNVVDVDQPRTMKK